MGREANMAAVVVTVCRRVAGDTTTTMKKDGNIIASILLGKLVHDAHRRGCMLVLHGQHASEEIGQLRAN
jgi:hypothetical protein